MAVSLHIGHAEKWDKLDLEGSIEDHDGKLSFQRAGKTLAVATIAGGRRTSAISRGTARTLPTCCSIANGSG